VRTCSKKESDVLMVFVESFLDGVDRGKSVRTRKGKDRSSGTGPCRSGLFRDRQDLLRLCRPGSSGSVSRLMFQVFTGNASLPQGASARRVGSSRSESRVSVVELQTINSA
jgi:hypothetical protein